MKTIIAAVITCMLLFGASYAASVYFAQAAATPEEESTEESTETESGDRLLPEGMEAEKTDLPMQVSNQANQPVALETVLQMSESIRAKEERIRLSEKALKDNEERVEMLFEDLKREKSQLKTMADSIEIKIDQMNRMQERLNVTMNEIEARRAEVARMEKENGADDASLQKDFDDRVDTIKGWFSGLPAEQASEVFKDFANNGKLELAAALLQKMPDRQKAKVLGAMNDSVLIEQLVDAIKVKPKAN